MYKLIVVDDEIIARDTITQCLQNAVLPFQVVGSFSNGAAALEYVLQNPVDVVVTDIKMPKLSGIDFAKEIHKRMLSIKTVIITGFGEFEFAKAAIQYNVFNYILKPLDFQELFETLTRIASILDEERPYNSDSLFQEQLALFFTDLLLGVFNNSPLELRQSYESLGLPISYNQIKGSLLSINVHCSLGQIQSRNKQDLQKALVNILKVVSDTVYIYPISEKSGFNFLLLYNDGLIDYANFILEVRQLLKLEVSIIELLDFHSLRDVPQLFKRLDGSNSSAHPMKLRFTDVENDEQSIAQKAKKYIEQNYYRDITRDEVAEAMYMNPSYFSRYFRNNTGKCFSDYLVEVRMKKAIHLLSTRMKISDIAEKVGYRNSRFFSNTFKKVTSYTPNEYRKKLVELEGACYEEYI